MSRKLLVLDLDETLVHASHQKLAHAEDFQVGSYFVYLRLHLHEFVAAVLGMFDVGVWTSSGEQYAAQIVERIFPHDSLKFAWSSSRCTSARDWTTGEYTATKNLAKLKKHGYALEAIIAVDDTPSKYARSYGNLITVREFTGDRTDDELRLLASYLEKLSSVPNVRSIEKRGWRKSAPA